MKIHKKLYFLFLIFVASMSFSQDSLNVEILKKVSTHFEINNHKFSKQGADFFKQEIEASSFILLGEYHHSKQISAFTNAIIPIFKKSGGNYFGLEIGPSSAQILQELSSDPETTVQNLKLLNTNNAFKSSKRTYTPIPFFSNVSDAFFLKTASRENLKLIGLDQEFKFGFVPLMEKMFTNLSKVEKDEYREDYKNALDTLNTYYTKEFDYYDNRTTENKRFAILMKNSKSLNDYFDRISLTNILNKSIVGHIRTSVDIYWNVNIKNYWEGNKLRTDNFISNMSDALKTNHFNLEKDKMLIKIGGLHSAKGLNNYRMYDIGNSIYELARLNNKKSLHTVFLQRYSYDANGLIVDEMEDTDSWYYKSFKDFLQMGKRNEWTIIDLRILRSDFYYKRKYLVNDSIKEYFDRYDLIIITPLDEIPTMNINE